MDTSVFHPQTNFNAFFLVALAATVAYAVQGTLLAGFFRRLDRLSVVTYRGLALGLTLLPLLLFIGPVEPSAAMRMAPFILAAAAVAAVGNWCGGLAYSFLPVGIASALAMSFAAVVSGFIGFAVLGESLHLAQLAFVGLTLSGIVALGAARSTGPLPREYNVPFGILHSLLFGGLTGIAFALIGCSSRQVHPFLVAYSYEFLTGIVAGAIAIARGFIGGNPLSTISRSDFTKILAVTSPTIVGTGCFAVAVSIGPVALATAILSTMMVFKTLLAMAVYHERPTVRQWCLLAFVCATVIGLKLSS